MAGIFINNNEINDLIESEKISLDFVRQIYYKLGEHMLSKNPYDQIEARDLKRDLDDHMDGVIGIVTNPETHSPAKHRHTIPNARGPSRKRGRIGGGRSRRVR